VDDKAIPFRLYDFLAYLFPGMATMHALFLIQGQPLDGFTKTVRTDNAVIDVIIALVAAYLIGLFWSVISRDVLRRLVWKCSNPRIEYFEEALAAKSPLGVALNAKLREKVREMFGEVRAEEAHRLCRVFVCNQMPKSWARRESVVGVRSMCANCVGPLLLYAAAFLAHGFWLLGIVSSLGSVALLSKMIALDQREWKEVYFAFLVAMCAPLPVSAEDGGSSD